MSSIYLFGAWISTIILVLVTLLSQIRKNPKKLLSNPPGKTGWPFIGETLTYLSNPQKFMQERMSKHSSEVFTSSLAGKKMAVFCGPKANQCIFSNEGTLFSNWFPDSVSTVLCNPKANYETKTGKPSNEYWFKFLKVDSIQQQVPIVDAMMQQHLEAHWVFQDEVKVYALARGYMLTTSLRVFLNYSNRNSDKLRELSEPFWSSIEGIFCAPINLPGTAYHKAVTGSKLVLNWVVDHVSQRRLALSEHNLQDDDACLDLTSKWIMDKPLSSNVEIAKSVIGLMIAGTHPTSSTITFTVAYLAEHPHVYELVLKEQQEIAKSKGSGEPLTWTDVQKMKYSWNVICETMRLKPAITGTFRTVLADFTYAGYQILKGCKVFWTPHSTNTDPKYFDDPEKFDPSRFEKAPAPYTFVPFGAGSRMCAGQNFVRIVTLVFLHHVVTKFKFVRVNPKEKITFNPDPVPTEGLRIYLQPHDLK